jgi:hypothetical protein
MKKEILKRIAAELANANQRLSFADYRDLLDEVAADVEGRLEGLKADEREAE